LTAAASLPFADTNVLLYLISQDAAKAKRAEKLLAARVSISVQVLNEFANVARRKHGLQWHELKETLAGIRHFADLHPISLDTHLLGLALAERYRFSLYDAMIVAAALQAGCDTLLSEDFQAGQVIDRRLKVVNPFAHDSVKQ
jgi:predicted nucleic acid-binding protein